MLEHDGRLFNLLHWVLNPDTTFGSASVGIYISHVKGFVTFLIL